MKKILLVALMFFGMMAMVQAQYSWTQKADLGGMKRQAAVGFAINKNWNMINIFVVSILFCNFVAPKFLNII